jgi:hypothetical protein
MVRQLNGFGWIVMVLSLGIVLAGTAAAARASRPDHKAPTVTLSSPASGSTVSGIVTLSVSASDRVGVAEVDYYVDGAVVAKDTAGPDWSQPWNSASVANGGHSIFAKARDAAGNWGTSSTISVTVKNATVSDATAPTVAVTAPAAGGTVSGTTNLSASASDNVGVTQVKWYVDGVEVAWDGDGSPWTKPWSSTMVANGTHRIFAKAADAAGNWGTSAQLSFMVSNGGSADTTAPSAPSNFVATGRTQTTIASSWTASSDNLGVAGYNLYLNGTKLPTPVSGTSYTFSGLGCGTSYTLGVAAFDAAGNVSARTSLSASTSACSSSSGYQHVVWLVMENHSYAQIIGNTVSAPYINRLAQTYGLATQMYAESHPSLPNYIAMTSGSTQGISDDSGPGSHPLNVANIFTQTGLSGRSLEESMPANCDKSDSGNYAVRHNPAVYYTNYTQCGTQNVPLGATPDLSAAFTFITPNLCHDMHSNSCTGSSDVILQGDQWLQTFVPALLATPQYLAGNTVIFITWDEDNSCSGCNNHIPTIVISPTTNAIQSTTSFNHYSLLRTTEELLGITSYLGNAASATSMRSAFHL